MNLSKAKPIAESVVATLQDVCEPDKCMIVGSVRRERPEVHDIEVVCISRLTRPVFGLPQSSRGSLLEVRLAELIRGHEWQPHKNGQKYKQFLLPQGIKLDLFVVIPPATWGVIATIRTGSARFSRLVVSNKGLDARRKKGLLPNSMKVKDGRIVRVERSSYGNGRIKTDTEQEFFDAIGLVWIDPTERDAYAEQFDRENSFEAAMWKAATR